MFLIVRCKIACKARGSLFSVLGFDLPKINFEKHFSVYEVSGTSFQNVGGVLYPVRSSC